MGEVLLPLTPDPSPLPGARGAVRDFVAIKNTKSPPRTRRLPSAARLTTDHLRRRHLQPHNPATEGTANRRHHRLAIVHPHTKIFLRLTRQ